MKGISREVTHATSSDLPRRSDIRCEIANRNGDIGLLGKATTKCKRPLFNYDTSIPDNRKSRSTLRNHTAVILQRGGNDNAADVKHAGTGLHSCSCTGKRLAGKAAVQVPQRSR